SAGRSSGARRISRRRSLRQGSSGCGRSRPRRSRRCVPRCGSKDDPMSDPDIARTETGGGFAVEVPGFAGPFRLLADLVLEQKVDVCDVPIATVTGRFLAYATDAERWNLAEATWVLAI